MSLYCFHFIEHGFIVPQNYITEAEHHLQEAARLSPSTDSQAQNQPPQDRLPPHSSQEKLPRHKEQSRKEQFSNIPKR